MVVLTVSKDGGLLIEPEVAVMSVVPTEMPVTKPVELIVAVAVSEEVQVAQLVLSPKLLSL
jgi:hypothetical protein